MLMNELTRIWYLTPCILGVLTCIQLLLIQRGSTQLKKVLVALLLALLGPSINIYTSAILKMDVAFLTYLAHNVAWCYGPLMFLLVRHICLINMNLKLSWMHFVLPILCLFGEINPWWHLPAGYVLVALCIQATVYWGLSLGLLVRHKERLLKLISAHKHSSYYWVWYLVVSLGAILLYDLILHLLATFGHFPSMSAVNIMGSLIIVYVCSLALVCIYQPSIFFMSDPETSKSSALEVAEQVESMLPLRNIELTQSAAKDLEGQLQKLASEYPIYLDEDMNLRKLSGLLGISTHHLSELLNVHMSTNFYDYLNKLRYQESIRLLGNTHEKLSIEDIAYRSGFNNRNSFYKVFKQQTGLTPKAYQQKNLSA